MFKKTHFLGLNPEYCSKDTSRFYILPIPYESTTTYGKGTKNGPKSILDASTQVELFDEELHCEPYKSGIHTLPPLQLPKNNPKKMVYNLSNYIEQTVKTNKIIISLGGEHSITTGLIQGHKKTYPNLSVLHLDAHADLRDTYNKSKYNHACAARRINDICPIVSCGVRSLSSGESSFIDNTDYKIYYKKQCLTKIDEIKLILTNDVYITLDVDIMDPSIMPSTGTPEPDGWLWNELTFFLKDIILSKNIVGLDTVELSPKKNNISPEFSTAKLLYRLIGYIQGK